jgi:hypothetical protein
LFVCIYLLLLLLCSEVTWLALALVEGWVVVGGWWLVGWPSEVAQNDDDAVAPCVDIIPMDIILHPFYRPILHLRIVFGPISKRKITNILTTELRHVRQIVPRNALELKPLLLYLIIYCKCQTTERYEFQNITIKVLMSKY